MDEFLGFWLSTVVLSAGFNISNDLVIIKDIYDSGCKINMENIDRYDIASNNTLDNQYDSCNYTMFTLLVPIINMLEVSKQRFDYNKNRKDFLELLYTLGIIEEMTPLEKEIYQKHPNIFNALLLDLLVENRIKNANVIEIRTNNEYGDIYYEMGENISEIKILMATGDMVKISTDAQIERVKSAIYGLINQCVDDFMHEIGYDNSTDDEFRQQMKKQFMEYALELLTKQEKNKSKKRTRKK